MGVERVVLEHHRDIAVLRRHPRDIAVADVDRPAADRLEPGEHAKAGGLTAPRRTDEDEEFALGDREVEVADGGGRAPGVDERDVVVVNPLGHGEADPFTGRNVPDDPLWGMNGAATTAGTR